MWKVPPKLEGGDSPQRLGQSFSTKFPQRELLKARTLAEPSAVMVEAEGTTLTAHSEPYNRKAVHAQNDKLTHNAC